MHDQKKCYLSFYTSDLYSLLHINTVNRTGSLPFYVSILQSVSICFQIIFQVYIFAHNFLSIQLHWSISSYLWTYFLFWDVIEMSLFYKTTLWRMKKGHRILNLQIQAVLLSNWQPPSCLPIQISYPIFQTFTWWYFTKNPLLYFLLFNNRKTQTKPCHMNNGQVLHRQATACCGDREIG